MKQQALMESQSTVNQPQTQIKKINNKLSPEKQTNHKSL